MNGLTEPVLDEVDLSPYLRGMAKEIPSDNRLRRKFEVADDETRSAAGAYLKDKPFAFKFGHWALNPKAAS